MVTMMLGAYLAASTALAPALARGSAAGRIVRPVGPTSGATAATSRVDEPAVRVTLTGRNVYDPGDRVRVRVHVRDDSYLVVLHADAGGHVRVLYPLNPGNDNFVHAGEDFDVRGNNDEGTFVVVDARGKGTIYAAVSKDPYHFDAFTSGEQWNAGAFPDTARGEAAESVMTEIAQQMAPTGGRFDYDLAVYSVAPRQHPQPTYAANEPPPDEYAYATPQYYPQYYPEYVPVYYPYYDPWFWRPAFFGRPFFEDAFFEDEPFFSAGFGIGWGGCWGGCWDGYYGPAYGGTVVYNRPLVNWQRPSGGVPPVGYRPRGDFAAGRYGSLYPGRVGSFTNYRSRTTLGGRQPTIFANAGLATSRGGVASVGLRTRTTTASSTIFRQHTDVAAGQPGAPRAGDRGFGQSTVAQPRRAVPVPTRNAVPTGAVTTPHGPAPATAVRARQPEGSWGATGGAPAAPTPRVETHQAPTRVEPRSTPPVASPHVESPHAQPRSTPHAYRATAQRVEPVPQPQYSGRDYATPYGGGTRGTTQYNAQPRRDAAPQYVAPQYSAPQYSAPRNEAPRTAGPRYEAPSYQAPHYDAPRAPSGYGGGGGSAPHASAPAPRSSGGGGYRGGGGGGGGGGSHSSGGGHHR